MGSFAHGGIVIPRRMEDGGWRLWLTILQLPASSLFLCANAPDRLVDISKHFGDRLEQLPRHHVAQLALAVQRPGQGRVRHDRDLVLLRHLSNLRRQEIGALGHHDRRGLLLLVVHQRHRVVGRVGHDYVGLLQVLHHPAAGHLTPLALERAANLRALLLLPHLLLDLFLGHAQHLVHPLTLEEVVDTRQRQPDADDLKGHPARDVAGGDESRLGGHHASPRSAPQLPATAENAMKPKSRLLNSAFPASKTALVESSRLNPSSGFSLAKLGERDSPLRTSPTWATLHVTPRARAIAKIIARPPRLGWSTER